MLHTSGTTNKPKIVPLSHAKDSASHLMDIVNDLISLSAIESGTLQLGAPRRHASDNPHPLAAPPDAFAARAASASLEP